MEEPFLQTPDPAESRLDIKPSAEISPSDANLIANLNNEYNQKRLSLRSNSLHVRSDPPSDPNKALLRQIFFGAAVVLYFGVGIAAFAVSRGGYEFKPTTSTVPAAVDSLYYVVATLSTIGYGDISPDSTFSKLFACFFILLGFGFVDTVLNGLVLHVCDRYETVWLRAVGGGRRRLNFVVVETYVVEKDKGRMRVGTKVVMASLVVVVCIGIGTVAARLFEGLSWVDSFYLSVTSVTTVGYGNKSFKSVAGRSFAAIWVLLSTVAVARAILYLAELRIDTRNRQRPRGSIRQSEFMIYKLRQRRKVAESDVRQICEQFDLLEHSNFSLRLSEEQKMVI